MKRVLAVVSIILLCGCAVASIKITEADGRIKEATSASLLKDISGGKVDLINETFNVKGSTVDLETLLKLLQVTQ